MNTAAPVAAIRVGTSKNVHAGYLSTPAADSDPFQPVYVARCAVGRRVGERQGEVVEEALTCGHCLRDHADTAAEIHQVQEARRRHALNVKAVAITYHLPAMAASLADTISGLYPQGVRSAVMTCFETDALAVMLLAAGQRDAAETVIYVHAASGSDDDPTFHDHFLESTDADATAAFAAAYIELLIERHHDGTPVYRRADDQWGYLDTPVWTVVVNGPQRFETDRAGTMYVLHADVSETAEQVGARALRYHVNQREDVTFDPGTMMEYEPAPMYIVQEVRPGMPDDPMDIWNDLRNCRL